MKRSRWLVTGGAGFIGSEFVRQTAARQRITVVDSLTYSGDLARIKEVRPKIKFIKADIADYQAIDRIMKSEKPDVIVHFAAETHVDRSISDALPFIRSNIIGTQCLVNAALKYKTKKFIHVSTDEVYGEGSSRRFKEGSPLRPNNPYAATKAAAEHVVRSAIRTFDLPAIIVRPCNNYGPWQYPEKLIPVIIKNALKNKSVPIYGKGQHVREWLYVADCSKAVELIIKKGKIGETYNVGTIFEQRNIHTARTILKHMEKPLRLIKFVKDRPGHDFRYSVDPAKINRLGFKPSVSFAEGIQKTIDWYACHPEFLYNNHKNQGRPR